MDTLSDQTDLIRDFTGTGDITAPVILTNLAGEFLLANDAAQTLLRSSGIHLVSISDLFEARVRQFTQRLAELAVTEAGSGPLSAVLPSAGGGEQWQVLVSSVSNSGGEVQRLSWQIRPLLVRRGIDYDQLTWLEFLSGAPRALHASLDLEDTLQIVASTCVPFMADWCTIDLVGSADSYLRRAAVYHVDPDKAQAVYAMRRRYPVTQPDHHPVVNVVRTGTPVLISRFSDDRLDGMTRDEEHRSFIDSLELGSGMIVPLPANGGIMGAITFCTAESGRNYTEADLQRGVEYANQAALAIGNARTHQHAVQVSSIREHYLSVASHELRTPLAVVGGFATMLARHLEKPEPERETIDMLTTELQHGVDRLESLTEDLLVASSLQQTPHLNDLERVDLLELLDDIVQRLTVVHPEAEGQIIVSGDENLTGCWNADLLDRAFSNLIANAIKYSPDGIDVRVVAVDNGAGHAKVSISDSGIGISEEDQESLFLPFTRGGNARRVSDGTGLGLYITMQIIEQHHGTMDLHSTPGEGTTFVVVIPRERKTSAGL